MLSAPASRIAVLALRGDVAAISAVIVRSGRRTPARRYVSYLTPGGFAEKSRLMRNHVAFICLLRGAKADCLAALRPPAWRTRITLIAGIAAICALDDRPFTAVVGGAFC